MIFWYLKTDILIFITGGIHIVYGLLAAIGVGKTTAYYALSFASNPVSINIIRHLGFIAFIWISIILTVILTIPNSNFDNPY